MILNKVNSQYLGELFCIGTEEGKPLVWAKKINLPDSDEIFVEFNLYLYDVNFNTESMFEKDGVELQIKLNKVYKYFLNEIDKIESLVDEMLLEFIEETDDIYNIEDFQFSYNIIRAIWIYNDGYAVIMKFPGITEEIGYEKRGLFEEHSYWCNLDYAKQFAPVEMDYYEVKPKLLPVEMSYYEVKPKFY